MDVRRSLVKLTIGSGCVLGGLAFPPLLAGEGIAWGVVLATTLASVTAGNTANAIDALTERRDGDRVSLENEDLTRAVGKAIAAVITLAAESHRGKTRRYLEKIAAKAKDNWVIIAQEELAQKRYPELREAQLDQFLTPEEYQLTQQGNLKDTEWGDIFIRLNMAACKGGGFPIPADVRAEVAELLYTTFPKALRETLKEDFANDGKAFAGLTLQLLTGMQAQLSQLRTDSTGVDTAELTRILQQFQEMETQLQGSITQQQAFFSHIADNINSGFAEVCQQLGVMETTITGLLQSLEERLEELRQEVTEFRQEVRQGFESLHNQPGGRQLSKQEYRQRQNVLTQMQTEVESRLSQSIHRAAFVNLGKEQQPQQVQRPWDMSVKVGEQRSVQLPPQTTILDVFDNPTISGKFLILGKPGGGKTTTLLELAEALIERAEGDSDAPIPVILELSSWQEVTKRKFLGKPEKYDPSIKEWILSQLVSKGVSQEIGEQWLRDKELVLLFDGLDELQPERQAKCVRAINQFLSSEFSPLHLVVCSRKEEYEDYEEMLHLNGAICLEDLTNEQIRHYFTSVNLGEFWESIKGSEKIVDFIRQPLFLAVTSIAYQQIDVEEWRNCNTEERAIDYLLGVYRVNRLNLTKQSRLYEINKQPQALFSQNAMVMLSCFLETTNLNDKKNVFSIYSLQPSLLTESHKIVYNFCVFISTAILYLFVGLICADEKLYLSDYLSINDYLSAIFTAIIAFMSALLCCIALGCGFNKIAESEWSKKLATNKIGHVLLNILLLVLLVLIVATFVITLIILYSISNIESVTNSWIYWNNPLHRWIASALGLSWVLTGFRGEKINFINLIQGFKNFNIEAIKIFFVVCFFQTIVVVFFSFWHDLINLFANGNSIYLPEFIHKASPNLEIILWILPVLYLLSFLWILLPLSTYQQVNYTSKQSKHHTLLLQMVSFIILFVIGVFSGLLHIFRLDTNLVLNNSYVLGFIFGSFAGFSFIQYFYLRLTLWLTGQMPWNITRFLDYCTDRLILQRVGNRYRFIHRLVQEHFAKLEIEKE